MPCFRCSICPTPSGSGFWRWELALGQWWQVISATSPMLHETSGSPTLTHPPAGPHWAGPPHPLSLAQNPIIPALSSSSFDFLISRNIINHANSSSRPRTPRPGWIVWLLKKCGLLNFIDSTFSPNQLNLSHPSPACLALSHGGF